VSHDPRVEKHVHGVLSCTTEHAKRVYLQAVFGPPTEDPGELQFRALLVTALQKAGAWPPRSSRRSAFD
jgi:hypothetical protein